MKKLTLEPSLAAGLNELELDAIFRYRVLGLPEGHGALIQDVDYPRDSWTISRFRDSVPIANPPGVYGSASAALVALQREYEVTVHATLEDGTTLCGKPVGEGEMGLGPDLRTATGIDPITCAECNEKRKLDPKEIERIFRELTGG